MIQMDLYLYFLLLFRDLIQLLKQIIQNITNFYQKFQYHQSSVLSLDQSNIFVPRISAFTIIDLIRLTMEGQIYRVIILSYFLNPSIIIKQLLYFKIGMQNNSLVELKLKANQFIEDYQKQVTEQEYQKQKLKQNIMLEIMSNRHKSQTTQSHTHDIPSLQNINPHTKQNRYPPAPASQQRNLNHLKINNQGQYARSNSVPNALKDQQEQVEDNSQRLQNAEITFKMSKKRNNFSFQNRDEKKQVVQSNNSRAYKQNQFDEQEEDQDQKQTLRQISAKYGETASFNQDIFQISSKFKGEKQPKIQKSNKFKLKQPEIQPQSEESFYKKQLQQQPEEVQDKPGAIFLTIQQNQSLDVSQQNKKNYAFDIVMDKSDPMEDLQELKKRKIQQMEKKRQLRQQQFRKQEETKKLNNEEKEIKRSNSYLKGSNRSKISEDQEPQPPKSRSRKKIDSQKQLKVNLSTQNIVQQSTYSMKPPQQPQRASYYNQQQGQQSLITPKSINSEYRIDKSKGKNTIFRESPKRLDKSASKYTQQPKIEPKERKNTFSKQSNKKLLITAITNVCLPGEINRKQRQKLTDVIEKDSSQFFILLFKQYSRKVVKGIYTLDPTQSYLQKIYGQKAPQQITSQNVQAFYRFDSGSRQFKKLDGCKSFSLVVHAIDLA